MVCKMQESLGVERFSIDNSYRQYERLKPFDLTMAQEIQCLSYLLLASINYRLSEFEPSFLARAVYDSVKAKDMRPTGDGALDAALARLQCTFDFAEVNGAGYIYAASFDDLIDTPPDSGLDSRIQYLKNVYFEGELALSHDDSALSPPMI